jgi:transcriptional regulator with XRE-family HTH domain
MKAQLKPYKEKAEILGVESAYLNQIANGFRRPSMKLALKMKALLGIPLSVSRSDLFEANDATNNNIPPRPIEHEANV